MVVVESKTSICGIFVLIFKKKIFVSVYFYFVFCSREMQCLSRSQTQSHIYMELH